MRNYLFQREIALSGRNCASVVPTNFNGLNICGTIEIWTSSGDPYLKLHGNHNSCTWINLYKFIFIYLNVGFHFLLHFAYVLSYLTFVWSLLVPHLSFCWCLGRAVLCDCGFFLSIYTYIIMFNLRKPKGKLSYPVLFDKSKIFLCIILLHNNNF